ncbi:nuclease-related domain-containing protein [Bacillus sp. 31A1R]|uniref:Nuclease-related domain-containing protein n=1 Tax=Robertmurraya mangrovi TaxID=3098077 RepID=A0ABU5IYH0_9BACI|nr:nuclease-related domain-containing protein [Bacillus sp. 31A1R]MDZ5472213.1 nuclease-related domain-containing protein [Bacillus sp. 31A1R]
MYGLAKLTANLLKDVIDLIAKELYVPIKLQTLEATLRRFHQNVHKRPNIETDFAKSWAGYHGERSLKYYLNFLPERDYIIFFDLRLLNFDNPFQMDILVLSSKYALILEVKNILGTLYFDQDFQQLIRTINDKEEGLPNPIVQAKKQKRQLSIWLDSHHINLPVDYLVVISNPSTILKTHPTTRSEVLKRVVHSNLLLDRIEAMNRKYQEDILDPKQLRKLTKGILKSHTPTDIDIYKLYGVSEHDLITGVHCPVCSYIPMIRRKRSWYCEKCNSYHKDAHVRTLKDYFLLINKTITNEKCRSFLQLSSPDVANRLLTSMNLVSTAQTRDEFILPKPNFSRYPR